MRKTLKDLRAAFATIALVLCFAAGVRAAEIAIRGERIFFVDSDRRALKVRDLRTGEERDLFRTGTGRVSGFELSASSGMIATAEESLLHISTARAARSAGSAATCTGRGSMAASMSGSRLQASRAKCTRIVRPRRRRSSYYFHPGNGPNAPESVYAARMQLPGAAIPRRSSCGFAHAPSRASCP